MKRTATSVWKGNGKEGSGHLSTQSGVFNAQPYSAMTRFENENGKQGTNPEELIGAAHAGCFNMALAFALEKEGVTPDELQTRATVNIRKAGEGFEIDMIHLDLRARIAGIGQEQFQKIANSAKENCPMSKALAGPEITLEATLAQD